MTHECYSIKTSNINKALVQLQPRRLIVRKTITGDEERLWFLNSSWLCTIISSGHGAINMKLKQILDKLNVWRDSAVITKQTSQWDYYFPWAVLLYIIRCDILPPPHCSAAE